MAEEKQESVLDMDAKETAPKEEEKKEEKNAETKETAAKKPAIQFNVPLNTIVMICAITTILIAFFTQFIMLISGYSTFIVVCQCFKCIAICATVVLYLLDFLRNKNFNVTPAFLCVLLAAIFVAATM